MIPSFSLSSCRIPKARLALVGGGPDSESLKEHFKGTKTVLAGQMTGEALSQAFASADVFVMPSDTETLGFVVLESMASGVPVVGANAGGIPDLIDDGKVRMPSPLLCHVLRQRRWQSACGVFSFGKMYTGVWRMAYGAEKQANPFETLWKRHRLFHIE